MKKTMIYLMLAALSLVLLAVPTQAAGSKTEPVEIVETLYNGGHQDWTEGEPVAKPTPEEASEATGIPTDKVTVLWTLEYDTENYPVEIVIGAPGTEGLPIHVLEYVDGEWTEIGTGTGPTVTVPVRGEGPISVVTSPLEPTPAPTATPAPTTAPVPAGPVATPTAAPEETPEPSPTPPEPREAAGPAVDEPSVVSEPPAEDTPTEPETAEAAESEPTAAPEGEKSPGESLDIGDSDIPLALFNGTSGAAWALVNLVCAVLTVVFGGAATCEAVKVRRRKEEYEYENEKYIVIPKERKHTEDGEEVTRTELVRKSALWRTGYYDLIVSAAAVIVFLLTEDMRLPMCLTDKWTPLMVLILAVGAGVYAVTAGGRKLAEELAERIMASAAVTTNGGTEK